MNLFPGNVFRPAAMCFRAWLTTSGFDTSKFKRVIKCEKGGVIALVILFLPMAVLSIGIVADLGLVFTARRLVQGACDLGALAGCQELDWDLLAKGLVYIKQNEGQATAIAITEANLRNMEGILQQVELKAKVYNAPNEEPRITVEANCRPQTHFLKWLPGLKQGIHFRVVSESSVVERKKW